MAALQIFAFKTSENWFFLKPGGVKADRIIYKPGVVGRWGPGLPLAGGGGRPHHETKRDRNRILETKFVKQPFGHNQIKKQSLFKRVFGVTGDLFVKPPSNHPPPELLLYRGRPPRG